MTKAQNVRLTRTGLIGVALLCLIQVSFGAEDSQKKRIRESKDRIEAAIKTCRKAEKAKEVPDLGDLRAGLASLAADAPGLKALSKYQDHRDAWVALLAVRAIGRAPAEFRLLAGRLLASRVDPRYLNERRRPVYIETVRTLGRTGYLGGVKSMLKTLARTQDPAVCHAIIEAFGRLGDPQVLAILHDRLSTGTSVAIRGPGAGSQARKRSQNPRQGDRLGGGKNNAQLIGGVLIITLTADSQPVDQKKVVKEIYDTIEKLLGKRLAGWHEIGRHLREHKKEMKLAEAGALKKLREQEKSVAKLLK